MDKGISVEERIKRAEEIYNKRNGQYINTNNTRNKKRIKGRRKKLIMQIFICLIIYLAFYVFTNSNYIFSEEFLNQVRKNFDHNSKIYSIYLNIKTFLEDKITTKNEQNRENISLNEINNELTNKVIDEETSKINNEKNIIVEETPKYSIGGAKDEKKENSKEYIKKEDSNKSKEKSEKTQMEIDAEKIKKAISFIIPVKGRISSTFGWRNPTTSTVPKYHTGLDIAASKGTIIKSATDGKVILSSSKGDYGNHYKIQNGDVIIIYAHCSKLYLKEGDKVKKGDKIAEVGSTGNSTGPHLHFEIRIEDRLVDPQLILDI